MSKYHLTNDGPRACTAIKRACPLGGEHFDTLEEAESVYAKQFDLHAFKRSGGSLEEVTVTTVVSPFAGGRYFGCHVEKASLQAHLEAFRDAVGEDVELMEQNKAQRDRGYVYHLTVVTPPEMKTAAEGLTDFPETVNLTYLGVGRATDGPNDAWFVVCKSEEIAAWRRNNGLDPKDLHITLGFNPKDVHTKPKGEGSIVVS